MVLLYSVDNAFYVRLAYCHVYAMAGCLSSSCNYNFFFHALFVFFQAEYLAGVQGIIAFLSSNMNGYVPSVSTVKLRAKFDLIETPLYLLSRQQILAML